MEIFLAIILFQTVGYLNFDFLQSRLQILKIHRRQTNEKKRIIFFSLFQIVYYFRLVSTLLAELLGIKHPLAEPLANR